MMTLRRGTGPPSLSIDIAPPSPSHSDQGCQPQALLRKKGIEAPSAPINADPPSPNSPPPEAPSPDPESASARERT
eukprot:3541499-Rhodomonas_salina.2